MTRPILYLAIAVALVAVLTGCADPMRASQQMLCLGETPGFFWGLLHGCIAPFAFIGSLFNDDIAIYAACNDGGWYDFGYCIGIGAFSGGSHKGWRTAGRWTWNKSDD